MSIELEKIGLQESESITRIANSNPIFCMGSDKITTVANKILQVGHRSMPVIDSKNKLIGLITIMDILNTFLRKQNMDDEISTIMSRDVIFCNSTDSIGYVLQKFKISRRGRFPIIDNNKLIGIITERDFVKNLSHLDFNMKVRELMTRKPFFATPHISILDCLKSMVNTRYRRLPIVNNKKIVGIETVTDILKYLIENNFSESTLLKPVESIMIRDFYSISTHADVSDAVKIMNMHDVGGLPVIEEGILEGFITDRDILTEIV